VLYVTGQGEQGYIEAFPLSSGVLGSPITGSPFTTGNNPYGLAINSAGTYLYTANKTDNTISEFMINSDGSLTALPDSPVGEQYSAPVSLLVDQTQTTLYVANQGSTNVAAFTIASSGGLTMLTSSPFSAGSQPSFIAGDPSGNYLFVGNQSRPAIQSFLLDESDGTLTSVGTYTVPGTPTSIVVTN
jgi:6-phosphogluconolactonase (cycloisomerase 2 family)